MPTSADAVFDGVGTSAAARDAVVDGGLVGCDIVREKCGAPAPVTHFVCLEPQNRSSGKLIFGWVFHLGSLSVRYCVRYAQKCPVLGAGLRGGFLAFFNPLRVKEQSSLIFAGRIVGHSSDAWVIGLCGES